MFRALPALVLAGLGATGCTAEPLPHELTFTFSNTSSPGDLVDGSGGAHDIAFAPAILIVHSEGFELFTVGQAAPWEGLEAITEDGNNVGLINELAQVEAVRQVKAFAATDADYKELPLGPGEQVSQDVEAHPGDRISWVSMYGQSNDIFVGTPPQGLPAFTDDQALQGDVTGQLALYDGGTEVNQEPGVGADQAPRQDGPDTGEDEDGVVTRVDGTDAAGFAYPAVPDMLSLTVEAREISDEE